MWQNNAGFGIVLRWIDFSNHWFFTMETGGANARLYERVLGTAYQRATVAVSTPANYWTRLRVVDLGSIIRCYVEDSLVLAHSTTPESPARVGVQTNSASSGVHRCRRFVVHRRGSVV